MQEDRTDAGTPRVFVVIPGSVNYFYNQLGRRVAEVLRALGCNVKVAALRDVPDADHDLCLISNIFEVGVGYGDQVAASARLGAVRRRSLRTAAIGMESVGTNWYELIRDACEAAGVDRILDFGLSDQTPYLATAHRSEYRFVFNGLTPSEARQVAVDPSPTDAGRIFPWAFVGHQTHYRTALVDRLVQQVDPRGFAYLPSLSPCKERGSPHLNQRQFEAVLRRTRYQVWCAHHPTFYVEGERFRASLLSGGVPIKVVGSTGDVPAETPFRYLMTEPADLRGCLAPDRFPDVRRRFRRDFLALPPLTETLGAVLAEFGEPFAGLAGNRLAIAA